jgi:N-dimethylarginine dimethylaminohydrolase
MAKFLMCQPDYFEVKYSINYWMHPEDSCDDDHYLACRQWLSLYDKLTELGHVVKCIDPVDGLPDMCFVANAAIVHNGLALLSKMKHLQRYDETRYFAREFTGHKGWQSFTQEGAGDCLYDPHRNIMWAGHGQRSNVEAYGFVETAYSTLSKVVRLELVDLRFYHLDTCFCPLENGTVIWYPAAFTEASQDVVHDIVGENIISLYEREAEAFLANAVNVKKDIIMPEWSGSLSENLVEKGFRVHQLDMSAFIRAGGACKCLTLRLDQ